MSHQHNSTADGFIWDSPLSQTTLSLVSQRILMGFLQHNGFSPAVLLGKVVSKKKWVTVWINVQTQNILFFSLLSQYGGFMVRQRPHLRAPDSYKANLKDAIHNIWNIKELKTKFVLCHIDMLKKKNASIPHSSPLLWYYHSYYQAEWERINH